MSDSSAIEWTDATWNPVTGCTKVSPGCDHCYAHTFAERWRDIPGHPFEQGFDLRLWPKRLALPLTWRTPRRVFVNSMSDLFHDAVPTGFITEVFATMLAAGRHTFQVLTKRPGRMRSLLASPGFADRVFDIATTTYGPPARRDADQWWPLPNVWVGVSAETHKWAAVRVPALLDTPAAVRFISAEPLLGPIDLSQWLGVEYMDVLDGYGEEMFTALSGKTGPAGGLHWVIAGGESGHSARPAHPDWVRGLRDQCDRSGTAFFFKQWGAWRPLEDRIDPATPPTTTSTAITLDACPADWGDPHAAHLQRVGKKAAGRVLDGRTWNGYPAAHPTGGTA